MSIIGARSTKQKSGMGAPSLVAFVSDQKTEETLKGLVQEQLMTFSVVRRGSTRDAAAFLRDSASPRGLIIDISKAEVPLSEVDELINLCDPNTIVIVIGEDNDISLYRDLTLLGVADYVVKPITTELMRRTLAIRMGGNQSGKQKFRTGKVMAVTGARGGVGTTTFATNLAWMLSADAGRRVAVVDLDLQYGAVNMMLGIRKTAGFMEALKTPHRIDSLFLERTLVQKTEKLCVLSAEEPLEENTEYDPAALDAILEILSQRFHYVIIDLPRRPGELYRHVLEAASIRAVIANPTITAIRDLIRITRMVGREDLGQRALVVLNHTSPHSQSEISRVDFEKAVGRRVDYEIPFTKDALFADNSGQMLVTEDKDMAEVYRLIIDDLSGRPRPKGPMIKRLLG